uniref:Uncharacterized protein n=1 Tax=Setaria italica TaxID=4555 RepID=K3ZXU7_SETIT
MMSRRRRRGHHHAAERLWTGSGRIRGDPEAQLPLGELDEALDLGVVHEPVVVAVGAPNGEQRPQAGEPRAAAADRLTELLPADAAVAVGVELLQPALELRHRDRRPVLLAREQAPRRWGHRCHGHRFRRRRLLAGALALLVVLGS